MECRQHRLFVFLAVLVSAAWFPLPAAEAEPPSALREALLHSTVRIRYEREQNSATITGHGTAFALDLSQYGYAGRRYLLTAAHNVLDDAKRPYNTLKIEIEEGTRTYWSRCRAVAWDDELDVCLVEAGDEMPGVLMLAGSEPPVGSKLIMAGSPRGVPVKLFAGTLERKFERGTVRSSAAVPFDHGDSGGPIADPANGLVVGVAVVGVPKDGDLDHNIGLFVPVVGIVSFLEAHRKGAPVPSHPRTETLAARPAPRAPAPQPEVTPAAATIVLKAGSAEKAPPAELAALAPLPLPIAAQPTPQLPVLSTTPQAGPPPAPPAPAVATAHTATVRAEAVALPPPPAPVPAQPLPPPEGRSVYTVQKGDNLTRIARQHNVSLPILAEANRLKDPNLLLVGMQLVIPESR